MQLKRSHRAGWEYAVVALLIIASMWISLALYAKRDQVAKEQLMILELQRFRNEVTATLLEHRKQPTKPADIASDPFGNPYHYNPKRGWVSSTTPAYQDW